MRKLRNVEFSGTSQITQLVTAEPGLDRGCPSPVSVLNRCALPPLLHSTVISSGRQNPTGNEFIYRMWLLVFLGLTFSSLYINDS